MTNIITISNHYSAKMAEVKRVNTKMFVDSIAELTRSFQSGNIEAYNELYKNAYNYVKYTIIKTSNNIDSDVDDILQETFLAFYTNAFKIEDCRYALAWLKRTAINKTYDYLRNRSSIQRQIITFTPDESEESEMNMMENIPDERAREQFESVERSIDVNKVLDEISPAHRAVLKAFYLEGESIKVFAQKKGLSENVVKVTLFRARKTMKERYPA